MNPDHSRCYPGLRVLTCLPPGWGRAAPVSPAQVLHRLVTILISFSDFFFVFNCASRDGPRTFSTEPTGTTSRLFVRGA